MWAWADLASAQDPIPAVQAAGPITLDGRLDEPAWAFTPQITSFVRFEPAAGGAPPGTTEVRLVYDDDALYVGVRVDQTGYPVRSHVAPREQINEDDQIGIYLDTFRDGQNAAIFYVNPRGVQQDFRRTATDINFSWDVVYDAEGTVDDDGEGYTIEIRFPFRSLEFPGGGGPTEWGLIVTRKIPSTGEKFTFPDRVRNDPLFMMRAARLRLQTPPAHRRIDIIPALTLTQSALPVEERLRLSGLSEPLDAVHPSVELFRYGFTPHTALSATLLPDFSQIEADETPIELNRRFAFEYDERRPFFLDGFDLLEDRQETLYTRSIVEPLYGFKLMSHEGQVAVGVLHAVDSSPSGTVNEAGAPGFDEADVAGHLAATSGARVRLDAFDGGYVGMTFADKRVLGTAASHDAVGLDLTVPIAERWLVMASTLRAQTTDRIETLTGEETHLRINRPTGDKVGFNAGLDDYTPGFRKETGFLPQSGSRTAWVALDYTLAGTGAVDAVAPYASVEDYRQRDDQGAATGEGYSGVWAGVNTQAGPHEFDVGGGATRIAEQGPVGLYEMQGWWVEAWYEGSLGEGLEINPFVGTGRTLDFETVDAGLNTQASVTALIRPLDAVRLESELAFDRLDTRGAVTNANALRQRVYWQLDRTHGVRFIGEQTFGLGLDDRFIGSLLFTRLVHPGTAAYVGASTTLATEGGITPQEIAVFAKVTVLARP